MRSVWKYNLSQAVFPVSVPVGARPVHVGAQGSDVCIWFEVDTEAEQAELALHVVPTGGAVPFFVEHLGTAIVGAFVWHVYGG
jgi:hypothetical protein